jgi:hypothetical protein
MNMSAWENFEWIRAGEGGGRREGFVASDFSRMTEIEKSRAEETLKLDVLRGEPFAAAGLVLSMQLNALPFLRKSNQNFELSELARAKISREILSLSKLDSDFLEMLNFLNSNSASCRWEAVFAAINFGAEQRISLEMILKIAAEFKIEALSNENFQLTKLLRTQIEKYAPNNLINCSIWLDKLAYSEDKLELESAKSELIKNLRS